jgi:uncharacterized protein (DUF2384 family)
VSGRSWKDDPLENTPPVRGSGNFPKDSAEQRSKPMTRDELMERAEKLQGDRAAAEALISEPAPGLDYEIPEQLIQTPEGSSLVKRWLTRLEHGVYI